MIINHSQIIYIYKIHFKAVQGWSTTANSHNHTLLPQALFHNQTPIHYPSKSGFWPNKQSKLLGLKEKYWHETPPCS